MAVRSRPSAKDDSFLNCDPVLCPQRRSVINELFEKFALRSSSWAARVEDSSSANLEPGEFYVASMMGVLTNFTHRDTSVAD